MRTWIKLASAACLALALSMSADAATITLNASDGQAIAADTMGTGTKGVVLVHAEGRTRADWAYFAEKLSSNGFRVVSVDLRGHGASNLGHDPTEDDYKAMVHDVVAAAAYLKGKGAEEITVVGAQLGANLAMNAAVEDESIKNVVLLSPGLSIEGVRLSSAIGAYGDRPALFVASESDTSSAKAARLLSEKAAGEAHLELYPDAGAGTVMLNRAPTLEGLLVSWLNGTFFASKGESEAERQLEAGDVNDIETEGVLFEDRGK